MARKVSTREGALLGVLAIAAIAYYFLSAGPSDGRPAGEGEEGPLAAAGADAPTIEIELLAKAIEDYDPNGRNLFEYAERPPSEDELRRLREEEERRRRLEEEARRRAAEQAARRQRELAMRQETAPAPRVARALPPQVTLKYIGYLGPKDDRNAVFEDGDEIILARQGEIVKKDFRIVEIKYNSVVVGFTRPEFQNETHELGLLGSK